MSTERINYLVLRYADNSATGEEVEELFEWLRQHEEDESLHATLQKMATTTAPDQQYDPSHWESFIQQVLQTNKQQERKPRQPLLRYLNNNKKWWAAAAIFLLISTAAIIMLTGKKNDQSATNGANRQLANDILPGRERATLTLANGTTILLDSIQGNIVKQENFTVSNLGGRLNYKGKDSAVQYHTLSTPKGGQYKLQLPDGTEVWLNAASSITYPTLFTGTFRKVTVTGEAYFEVAKDKSKPFKVNVDNKSEVEVLGTHFNINSYADEGNIKTTLLEGSVKVTANDKQVVIKPGQQAVSAAGTIVTANPDLQQVMAWKNGLFNFDQATLQTVMSQLGRWYDIDVKYEGAIPSRTFRGKITRDLNLSQVIKILEDVEVKFRIEGRTLVVMP